MKIKECNSELLFWSWMDTDQLQNNYADILLGDQGFTKGWLSKSPHSHSEEGIPTKTVRKY